MPKITRLLLVLHAHLPWAKSENPPSAIPEIWLFEAVHECYLPLLAMLDRLANDRVPTALTFTLSPTLCAMLNDELIRERIAARLRLMIALAEKETSRRHEHPAMNAVTEFYREHWQNSSDDFERCDRDLLRRFRACRDRGQIEIIACSATHAVLPLLLDERAARRQIEIGCENYRQNFGENPRGFWLPECAYAPEIGDYLRDEKIEYTFLATHAFKFATPRPPFGVYSPIRTPEKIVALGRDPECSRQVWSAKDGYPGAAAYREFYRDLGWDGDFSNLREFFRTPDSRHDLGFKYHRITGDVPLAQKEIYVPADSAAQADIHAEHFLRARQNFGEKFIAKFQRPPLIIAPYDAELFGHWWFEGPRFIEQIIRRAAEFEVELVLPNSVYKSADEFSPIAPPVSSWGDRGGFFTWLNGENDWLYPRLFAAQQKLNAAEKIPSDTLHARLRRQMTVELLLSQSSDWTFILTTRSLPDYARHLLETHLKNFEILAAMFFDEHALDENFLLACETADNFEIKN